MKIVAPLVLGVSLLVSSCGGVVQTDKALDDMQNKIEKLEQQNKALEEKVQPVPTPTAPKTSNVEMKMQCQEYGEENYQDKYFDDGFIVFNYYYSSSLDTCILERNEMGPEPDQIVFKLYDMFTKEILLHAATFEAIGCAVAKECVETMEEYNARKVEILK